MPRTLIFGSLAAAMLAALGLVVLRPGEDPDARHQALQFGALTAAEFADTSFVIVPEMLAVIYSAFAQTGEDTIYDTLAQVAAAEALDTLYLERVGAMAGGGLAAADQALHAMELVQMSQQRSGDGFAIAATWQVVGTVGHATHMHVRGNTYAADLVVSPVDGAWRMTGFTLTDVDRSDAGLIVAGE